MKIKRCPPNKILNPKTDRCVLKTGAIGKELLKGIKNIKESIKNNDKKECPPDKILNPKTDRCVLKSGPIGKQLLKDIINLKKETKSSKIQKEIDLVKKLKEPKEKKPKEPKVPKEPKEKKKPKEPEDYKYVKDEKRHKKHSINSNKLIKIVKPSVFDDKINKLLDEKLEKHFGKPHMNGIIANIKFLTNIFEKKDHSFIEKNITGFINATDSSIKSICKNLIKNSIYISFSDFLYRLNLNISSFLYDFVKDENYLSRVIYINMLYTYNIYNNWLFLYIECIIKCLTNNAVKVAFINSVKAINSINKNDTILFINDCYYDANDFEDIINNDIIKRNLDMFDSINFHILVPFISNTAISKMVDIFNKKIPKSSKLTFATYKYVFYDVNHVISKNDIKKLNSLYKFDFNNKFMIYFNHSIGNDSNIITPIYAGIVYNKKNETYIKNVKYLSSNAFKLLDRIPLINNCKDFLYDCIPKIMNSNDYRAYEILVSNIDKKMKNKTKKGDTDKNKIVNDIFDNIEDINEFKKIVQNKYGVPEKNKLSELLKNTFKLFPLNHSLDKDAVKKFINASDPEIRDICKKIINGTEYISFETFITKINLNIYYLVALNITKNKDGYMRPMFAYLGSHIRSLKNKSNYWLYLYINEFIRYITNDREKLNLIISINDIHVNSDDIVVLIDDCIYSGQQMGNTVNLIVNTEMKAINYYLLVPYITKIGISRINRSFNSNIFNSKSKSKLIFAKYLHNPKLIQDVITREELAKINLYYKPFMNFYNKSLIYFDHKLADIVSTITVFYLGLIPNEKNLKTFQEMQINDIKKYGYFMLEPSAILNKLDLIPIIKNCSHYTQDIDMWSPQCPAPPYKKTFKKFINYIKSNNGDKKYNSLSLSFKKEKPNKKYKSF